MGTVMVLVARLANCPTAFVYEPVAAAADTNNTAFGAVTVFSYNVTAPFLANARPSRVAPSLIVIEVSASMFPLKSEDVPSVAELPTCQKTLAACAPLVRITLQPVVVMSVDTIWKIQTAFVSPPASRVRLPDDISSEDADL